MKKPFVTLLFFSLAMVACLPRGEAQIRKIMHKTFDLSDSIQMIDLDILDRMEKTFWPGNKIMLETNIKLFSASPGILDFLIEEGRYEVEAEKQGEKLLLFSKNKKRQPISNKGRIIEEDISMRLFIPDEFIQISEYQLRRQE
jgi:hypothetical protein